MNAFIFNLIWITSIIFWGDPPNRKHFVTLKSKTPISFILKEEIRSSHLKKGDAIPFYVQHSIFVNGQLIIPAGTMAEGRVKCITFTPQGICTNLSITMEKVRSIDGQTIYVRSLSYNKNRKVTKVCSRTCKDIVIQRGTQLNAIVLGDTDIDHY